MKEKIRKIWKDPVWKTVISTVIIGLGTIIFLPIQEWLLRINIDKLLKHELPMPIWFILTIFMLFVIFVYLINRLRNRKNIKWNREYSSLKKRKPGEYWELIFKWITEKENSWENFGKRIPRDIISFYLNSEIIEPTAWESRPYIFTDKGNHFVKIYLNTKYPEN